MHPTCVVLHAQHQSDTCQETERQATQCGGRAAADFDPPVRTVRKCRQRCSEGATTSAATARSGRQVLCDRNLVEPAQSRFQGENGTLTSWRILTRPVTLSVMLACSVYCSFPKWSGIRPSRAPAFPHHTPRSYSSTGSPTEVRQHSFRLCVFKTLQNEYAYLGWMGERECRWSPPTLGIQMSKSPP